MLSTAQINFGGETLLLDAQGALYWPQGGWLIVSDLHLEKASFLARFGSPLPRYDTRDTLARLAKLIEQYQPRELICLGDSFHDRHAFERLEKADRAALEQLVANVPVWRWVLGNHDPALSPDLPGERHATIHLHDICLAHERECGREAPQIIGHFHPKLSVHLGGHRVSGKVFIHDERLLIMPSLGSYTGGLDAADPAIDALLHAPMRYLIYREKLWKL